MATSSMTTNFPNGVTNTLDATQTTLGSYVAPDPSRVHSWFSDFDDYDANQWVITETGSGTRAVGNLDGGVLVITNGASDNDANFLQWSGVTSSTTSETFAWEAGRSLWFKARLKVSNATQTDFVVGLQITDTTPLAVSDGFYFQKDDDSTALYFKCTKSSTSTSFTNLATIANDTYFNLGFWWNVDLGELVIYYNGNPVASTTDTTNFTTHTLTLSFGVQNGDANARSMSLDYLFAAKDRHQTVA